MGLFKKKSTSSSALGATSTSPASILNREGEQYPSEQRYSQGMNYSKPQQYGNQGPLPSPPRSPDGQYHKQTQSHSQPRQQQSSYQDREPHHAHTASYSYNSNSSQQSESNSRPSQQQNQQQQRHADPRDFRTTPSSFSSSNNSGSSNVLYNDGQNVRSSAGTAMSDRDVEGRMGSLGLEGLPSQSEESVEMHDGRHESQLRSQQTYHDEPKRFVETRPISSTQTMSPTPSQSSSLARKTSSRYNLADFTFIRTLGTGSFGRVHLVKSQHNSRSYAVKVLSKERVVKMKQVEHTNSEREMLERVRHPFLVNLWGTFKCSKNLYMVMDFVAGGELFSLLRKSQRFPDPVAKFFAAEVALGLDYLHSLDIIYRDLKPENILLGADGHVKITDFGFAKHVPDITWTLCGTPDYLAPEIVQSRGYNKSVDWYALGVLMFEMLAGYPPFFTEDANPMRLYEKIIAGKVRYPSYFAPEAKDLLKSLLTSDITKRFGNLANGSRDIFGHTWFQEVDWERLYRKEIPAPYVPKVDGDLDASNFDQYPEVDLSEYGQIGPDPHAALFPLF